MTGWEPVVPVDASTVILVKAGERSPFVCFMVRRHVRSEFAADVFVFPGGKVDPADRDPALVEYLGSGGDLDHTQNGFGDESVALRVAAIRELFEEAGVLLAEQKGRPLRFDADNEQRYGAYRKELREGRLALSSIAEREGLIVSTHLLHPFSHWITPLSAPRRYDTRFFVAQVPEGQEPLHDAVETSDSTWIGPQEALDAYRQGNFPLVYATEKHLEQLTHYQSLEELVASTAHTDMTPITPRPIHRNGERIFLLPGEPGYEEADPKLAWPS